MRTGCHYLISLSVCVRVCNIRRFVLIASAVRGRFQQTPVSMEAGEYGLTRGTCFVARCLEVVAVAGLMWVSWCVFDGADFFRIFHEFAFSNSYTQSSQRRLGEGDPTASQSAHRQLAPTYPHQVYRLLCSHLRNMASSVGQ